LSNDKIEYFSAELKVKKKFFKQSQSLGNSNIIGLN